MRRINASGMVVTILCAMSFILYVDRVNLSTAAGPIAKELGLTNTQLGIALSAFTWTYAIFQIVGGAIADRLGPRRTLAVCALIWTATTVATGFIGSLFSLIVVRTILGVGEGATLPAAARAVSNWTPKSRRGFVQGITHSSSRLGNAVTPPIVAALVTAFSWRASFWVLGVLSFVWVLVWWFYFTDSPRDHAGITQAELEMLPDQGHHAKAAVKPVPWGPLLRRMLPTSVVYFCYGWSSWMFFTWLPTIFLQGWHMDIKNSAMFAAGVFFSGVVGDTLGGVVSDYLLRRTGSLVIARSYLIAAVMIASLLCLVPVLLTKDLVTVAICLSGSFFFLEMMIGPIWAVPIDVAPDYAGTASGVLNTGSALAGIITPVLFGIIVDLTGDWTLPFAGSIIVLLGGAFVTLLMRPDRRMAVPGEDVALAAAE